MAALAGLPSLRKKLRPIRNRSPQSQKDNFPIELEFFNRNRTDRHACHIHRILRTDIAIELVLHSQKGSKYLQSYQKEASGQPHAALSACATRPYRRFLRYATPTRRRRRISVFITS